LTYSARERLERRLFCLGSVSVIATEKGGSCSKCHKAMGVQKTVPHKCVTLSHGTCTARETVHACLAGCRWPSGARVTRRAACLTETLLPNSSVGYDVMVFVGRERFLRHQQREEIQASLRGQGVELSTGELSKLSWKFLDYLQRLHRARAKELRAVLDGDGGWPMHVDATGEAGRGTVLVVIAGWRRWVLGAWKIPTERSEVITACLRETVRRFGPPCAAMRDLGRAMIPALDELVEEQGLSIPVLACHQHFLADVGKDMLEPAHAQLRSLFRNTKVRPKLGALVRELGRELGAEIDDARKAVLEWQEQNDSEHRIDAGRDGLAAVRAMAQWVLDYKAEATGLDFPFDRPYLDLYDRAVQTLRASDAYLHTPPKDKKVTSALKRLQRYLQPVVSDVPFRQVALRLRRRAALFDELRKVLRVAATVPEDTTEDDLGQMRQQLDDLVVSLKVRRPSRGPAADTRDAIDIILTHVEKHGDNLWGHAIRLPKSAGGGVRLVSRTNFLAENFFGSLKHDERRRSGRKNLGQDLENMRAEATLVQNLTHDDYLAKVCGSLDDLPKAFANLDKEEQTARLEREPDSPILPNDDLIPVLQIASASLSTADRKIVRTEAMGQRIAAAAGSRATRCRC